MELGKIKRPETDAKLEAETRKWLARLEKEAPKARPSEKFDPKAIGNAMENVKAYIKDCRYFLEKKDYVNAFEAVVYAWGIADTLRRCGLVTFAGKDPTD
jgi:hypothetical protein